MFVFSVVYATTAANPNESSYACYYDSKLETYLGDCYSVNWMENVDSVSLQLSWYPHTIIITTFLFSTLSGWDSYRDTGEAVQDCEAQDEHKSCHAVWQLGQYAIYYRNHFKCNYPTVSMHRKLMMSYCRCLWGPRAVHPAT